MHAHACTHIETHRNTQTHTYTHVHTYTRQDLNVRSPAGVELHFSNAGSESNPAQFFQTLQDLEIEQVWLRLSSNHE
jgi:hypothetical protein